MMEIKKEIFVSRDELTTMIAKELKAKLKNIRLSRFGLRAEVEA